MNAISKELAEFQKAFKEMSWRDELRLGEPLNIQPGESVTFTFYNEGDKWERPGYKPAVVFNVWPVGEVVIRRLFVRSKELLEQIQALGEKIEGITVELKREGTGLETRWMLKKVE